MLRRLPPLVALLALAVAAGPVGVAGAQVPWPTPTLRTPEGPATLTNIDDRIRSRPGIEPELLSGIAVQIGGGSRAGRLRPRVLGAVAGPWTDVPAEPGTVVLPLAPPFPQAGAGMLDSAIAIDQDVGGQTIVSEARYLDLPEGQSVFSGTLEVHAGDPPPGIDAPVTERRPAQAVAMEPIYEHDDDQDGIPDSRQGTDLVTAVATTGSTPTRRRVVVTVVNRGPLPTSWADAEAYVPEGAVLAPLADQGCPKPPLSSPNAMTCRSRPLAPGASATVTFDVVTDVATTVRVRTSHVGPDLDPSTDEVTIAVPAPSPVLRLLAPARARLHGGALHLGAATTRPGTFRLRATIALGARRWHPSRSVPLTAGSTSAVALPMPAGLRRALRGVRRGPLATVVLEGSGATRVVHHVRLVP